MTIKRFTKNIKKENFTSKYFPADEHKFGNVVFRSACIENSPHPENKVAFIVDDVKKGERLICFELSLFEALIVIKLLSAGIIKSLKKK